jgi:hypothetical protein
MVSFIRSGRGKRRLIHRTAGDSPRAYCGALVGGKHSTRLAGIKSDDPKYCQECRARAAAAVGGFQNEPGRQSSESQRSDSSQKHETAGQCV